MAHASPQPALMILTRMLDSKQMTKGMRSVPRNAVDAFGQTLSNGVEAFRQTARNAVKAFRQILPIAVVAVFAAGASSVSAQAPPQPDPKSPQYQAKGEQNRTYVFPGTGESIPYHLYVPTRWTKDAKLPLVVVTHGAGQPATAPFQRPTADPTLARTAEARGYIVAAVTGYHANATGVGG